MNTVTADTVIWLLSLLLSVGGLALLGGWGHVYLQRQKLRAQEVRALAFASELGHTREARERLRAVQDELADSLDVSTRATRATHKAIADIPFSILERIPATRDTARQVRRIHDLTSEGVYAGISLLTQWQQAGRLRRGKAAPTPTDAVGSIDRSTARTADMPPQPPSTDRPSRD